MPPFALGRTAAVSVASFVRRKSRSTAAPPARLCATSFGAARFHPSAARCSRSPASSWTPWRRSGESESYMQHQLKIYSGGGGGGVLLG